MNFNYKSRKGFTLIELLVVIGILAVLAAIAIPSVAGLIDRANVSADNTNANEMTNAMERFVSEYELFRQDIASDTFDKNDMDAAQSRVYNVTKAETIDDIRALESDAGLNGIRIDIDNKYAQNHKTAKAVMQNYMKTSSSTFEPKQSDMAYWYNKVTGYTVVAGHNTDTSTLYQLLPTEVRYDKAHPAYVTEWINLSSDIIIPDVSFNKIIAITNNGAKYIKMNYTFPTPKYNEDVDLNCIYLLQSGKPSVDALNMDINSKAYCFAEIISDENKEQIQNHTYPTITFNTAISIPEGKEDTVAKFRIAYKYTENGVVKYAYSAIFSASWNELNQQ